MPRKLQKPNIRGGAAAAAVNDAIVVSTHHLTLGLVVFIGGLVLYLYYVMFGKRDTPKSLSRSPTLIVSNTNVSDTTNPLDNPYIPPLKQTALLPPRGLPVNIPTSTVETAYSQVGILTKNGGSDNLILPLMGRNLWNGRDKWQYYTMSNTAGEIHTKLPVRVNGKSGTGEYGCDSISTGDMVFVDGYNDQFRATVYETSLLQYLPF